MKSFVSALERVFSGFLFVDNPVCPVCKRIMFFANGILCGRCEEKLSIVPRCVCARCGAACDEDSLFCEQCQKIYSMTSGVSLYRYDAASSAVIKDFKYNKSKNAAYECGQRLAARLNGTAWVHEVDFITCVPCSIEKQKERGYNQSFVIACGISDGCGIMVNDNILVKSVNTKDQIGLGFEERFRNVKGAFTVADVQAVCGKKILIADDVFTSGATLNACSDVLLNAGASQVFFATVAYADQ